MGVWQSLKKDVRNRWRALTLGSAVALIFSVAGYYKDVAGIRTEIQGHQAPHVDIRFYEIHGGVLRLAPSTGPTIDVSPSDVGLKRINVPLRLAFHNAESKDLELVRVDLEYPENLNVTGGGNARIDPSGRRLIYEHVLGDLAPSATFTPIETIDTIHVPFIFSVDEFVSFAKDGVPIVAFTVIGSPSERSLLRELPLQLTLYCKDRPPVKKPLVIRLQATIGVQLELPQRVRTVAMTNSDMILLRKLQRGPERIIAAWRKCGIEDHRCLGYQKAKYGSGVYQLLWVDGVLKEVRRGPRFRPK